MAKTKKIITSLISIAIFIIPSMALAQWNIGSVSGFRLPNGSIYFIIENILLWLLAILGFIGIIGFVISGIMYLVSAGNDEAVKSAKKGMTASIIGVIVGLAGVVVIQAIEKILNAQNNI